MNSGPRNFELCWFMLALLEELAHPFNWAVREQLALQSNGAFHHGATGPVRVTLEDILGFEDIPF